MFNCFLHKCMASMLMLLCLFVISCHAGKQAPLYQLEKLTEDIRLHHEEYTTADWKEAYARYEQISEEMEKYQYSAEEAEQIGKLEGECVGYFVKSTINSFDGFKNEIKGFLDGIEGTLE